jgi:hypothetical protein
MCPAQLFEFVGAAGAEVGLTDSGAAHDVDAGQREQAFAPSLRRVESGRSGCGCGVEQRASALQRTKAHVRC